MKRFVPTLIAMIALTLLAVPAGASMQYYTSQAAWAAATAGVFVIDFDDIVVPSSPGYVDYSITGLQLHDVNFTANPEDLSGLLVCSLGCEQRSSFSGNYLRGNTWDAKFFQAALPADVYALSMLVLTDPRGSTVTFTFPTGETYTLPTYTDTIPDFIGFTSDQPIQSVTVGSAQVNTVLLDDFSYSQVTEELTPESSSLLLGGLGLAAIVVARRLRRFL